jgi:hypothetical protein
MDSKLMHSELYLKWVKDKGLNGLTRSQAEFAEWCLQNNHMILRIGSFSEVFQSINMWMKLNRNEFK